MRKYELVLVIKSHSKSIIDCTLMIVLKNLPYSSRTLPKNIYTILVLAENE